MSQTNNNTTDSQSPKNNPTSWYYDPDSPTHHIDRDQPHMKPTGCFSDDNNNNNPNNPSASSDLIEIDHIAATLRQQIHDQLLHNNDRNHLYLCELLVNLQTARICDAYLYAFCTYKVGDYMTTVNILRRYNLIFDLNSLTALLPAFNRAQIDQYAFMSHMLPGDDHPTPPPSHSILNTSLGSLHIIHNASITEFLTLHDVLLCVLLYTRCLYELKRFSDLTQIIGSGIKFQPEIPHNTYNPYDELLLYSLQQWGEEENPSYIVEVEQIWLMIYQFWYMGQDDKSILAITFLQPIFDAVGTPTALTQTAIPLITSNGPHNRNCLSSPLQPQSWRSTISQLSYFRAKVAAQLQYDSKITAYYLSKTFFFNPTHLESFKTLIDCEFIPAPTLELFLLSIRSHYDLRSTQPIFFPSAQTRFVLMQTSSVYLDQLDRSSTHLSTLNPAPQPPNLSFTRFNQQQTPQQQHHNLLHTNPSYREQQNKHDNATFPFLKQPIPITLHFAPNEIAMVTQLIAQLRVAFTQSISQTERNIQKETCEKKTFNAFPRIPLTSALDQPRIVQHLSLVHKLDCFNTSWLESICIPLIRSKSFVDIDGARANIQRLNDTFSGHSDCQQTVRNEDNLSYYPTKAKAILASKSINSPQKDLNTIPAFPSYGIINHMTFLSTSIPGARGLESSPLLLSALAETLYRQKRVGDCFNLCKHIIYKLDRSTFELMLSQFPQYQRYAPLQSTPLALIYPNCVELFALCCWELGKVEELFSLCSTLTDLIPNNATLWYCLTIYYFSSGQLSKAESLLQTCPILSLNHGVNTTFISNQLRLQRLLVYYYATNQQYDAAVAVAKRISNYFPLSSWEHVYLTKHYLQTIVHKQIVFKAPYSMSRIDGTHLGLKDPFTTLNYAYFNELSTFQLFSNQLCPCFKHLLLHLGDYLQMDKDLLEKKTNGEPIDKNTLSKALQSFSQVPTAISNNTNDINPPKLGHDQLLDHSHHHGQPYSKLLCFCGSDLLNRFEFYLKLLSSSSLQQPTSPHNNSVGPISPLIHNTCTQIPMTPTLTPILTQDGPIIDEDLTQSDISVLSTLDPTLLYLFGMSFYRQGAYTPALYWFKKALLIYQLGHSIDNCSPIQLQVPSYYSTRGDGVQSSSTPNLRYLTTTHYLITQIDEYESLLLNIAQCYRKLGQLPHAILYYSLTLSLSSSSSSSPSGSLSSSSCESPIKNQMTFECYVGLGMSHHLLGIIDKARDYYILAFANDPSSTLAQQLLTALSTTTTAHLSSQLVPPQQQQPQHYEQSPPLPSGDNSNQTRFGMRSTQVTSSSLPSRHGGHGNGGTIWR